MKILERPSGLDRPFEGEAAFGPERDQGGITIERVAFGDRRFADAQSVEYAVFLDAQYITPNKDGVVEEYSNYNPNSVFDVAYGPDGTTIMGVLREIHSNKTNWTAPTDFKTLNDLDIYPEWIVRIASWQPNQILEAGTSAVLKQYRRSSLKVAQRLHHCMYANAMAQGRPCLISSIDRKLLRAYTDLYGFEHIGPTEDYMGSPTTPVAWDMRFLETYLYHTNNPDYRRMLIEGDFS